MLRIVNQAGDADTNAAVACALMGARWGASAIPRHLLRGLNDRRELEERIARLLPLLAAA